jgi:hypothetical protein
MSSLRSKLLVKSIVHLDSPTKVINDVVPVDDVQKTIQSGSRDNLFEIPIKDDRIAFYYDQSTVYFRSTTQHNIAASPSQPYILEAEAVCARAMWRSRAGSDGAAA